MNTTTTARPHPAHQAITDQLLHLVELTRCPVCGTVQSRCRIWTGGIGHTLGFHPDRVTAARNSMGRIVNRCTAQGGRRRRPVRPTAGQGS